MPLARVDPGAPLPLLERVNPAWSGALQTLHRTVVAAVFGPEKTSLSHTLSVKTVMRISGSTR